MEEKIMEIINQIRFHKDLEPVKEFKESLDLRKDLELDSLDLAELTVRIEQAYGIDVFEDGLVSTVGEIIKKLKKAND
jgi:acyl carrier protein